MYYSHFSTCTHKIHGLHKAWYVSSHILYFCYTQLTTNTSKSFIDRKSRVGQDDLIGLLCGFLLCAFSFPLVLHKCHYLHFFSVFISALVWVRNEQINTCYILQPHYRSTALVFLVQGEQEKKKPIVIPATFTLGGKRGFAPFLCRKNYLTLLSTLPNKQCGIKVHSTSSSQTSLEMAFHWIFAYQLWLWQPACQANSIILLANLSHNKLKFKAVNAVSDF